MAIYSSVDEMNRPQPAAGHRATARWAVMIAMTAFLALLCFLQSEEAADQLVALQDVVKKKTLMRGNANNATAASFQTSDAPDRNDNENTRDKQVSTEPETHPSKGEGKIEDGLVKVIVSPEAKSSNEADTPSGAGAQETQGEAKKDEDGLVKVVVSPEAKGSNEVKEGEPKTDSKADTGTAEEQPNDACPYMCSSRAQQHKERWGGDLLNMTDVKRLAKEAIDKFIANLKTGYGEDNFAKIFEKDGESRGKSSFLPANPEEGISLKRFKRKLQMKILSAQVSIEKDLNSVAGCDCTTGVTQSDGRHIEAATVDKDSPPFASHYARLVWATGGHSSAAGHGNLFNESYTAVLEQALSGIFGAIGVEFEGRSSAMGGTNAAPEIALCEEAIMGTDIDVISWDYGMTDGRLWDRKGMYANRAGLNPNRPAIVDMFIDKFLERRSEELRKVEERGLTAFYMNANVFDEMKDGIPDTFGRSSAEIDMMPRMVRHFKCQGAVEKGDPTCDAKKYDNDDVCPDRNHMASWHPGWKLHALSGNAIGLFMGELLLEAITELGSVSDRSQVLRNLQLEEDSDYKRFIESDFPDPEKDFLSHVGNELFKETDASVFFRSPSICHTARLPSQTRYLGILTESEQKGVKDYFKGVPKTEAHGLVYDTDMPMPLVYDENERQSCEYELKRDYKDYFFASNRMGWTTLTFPNEAEQLAYGREAEKRHGLIILCPKTCDWGRCPKGDMQKEAMQKGQVKFEINGKPVVNVTEVVDCVALRGENGHSWQPNDNGRYVLKAKVLGDGSDLSFLRISSLILL